MKKIKVGCVGLGPRGVSLFKTLLKCENVVPYAVCDCEVEKLNKTKEWLESDYNAEDVQYFTSYDEMFKSDVEAVIIATHVETHAKISAAALYAKKHVLCEIPNIANVEEAKFLAKAVKDNPDAKFMVAEECCYWGFIKTYKEMYDQGILGDIVYAESDYIHSDGAAKNLLNMEEYAKKPKTWRSYLPAITYLTHNLGPLLYITGDVCTEICGFIPDNNPYGEDVHPGPPNGAAMIKTAKGSLFKIFIGFCLYRREFGHNFILYGTRGSVENERTGPFNDRTSIADLSIMPNTHSTAKIPVKSGYPGASTEGHGGADFKMMEAFVDCIENDKEPELGIEFGINISLPGIYADLSSREHGKMYKMPTIEEILNS